jgi:tellurite resistance protein
MPTLIFGTEPNPIRVARGVFHCLQCMRQCPFQRTNVKRTLSILTVRVPLGSYGEYVECETCQGTFRPEALAYDAGEKTRTVMAEYQRAMLRILALMVAADGTIQEPEIEMVQQIFESVSGIQLSRADVLAEVRSVGSEPTTAARYLARVVGYVNEYGKEQILRAAVLVSRADGRLHEDEATIVRRFAAVMRMPAERTEKILTRITAS